MDETVRPVTPALAEAARETASQVLDVLLWGGVALALALALSVALPAAMGVFLTWTERRYSVLVTRAETKRRGRR